MKIIEIAWIHVLRIVMNIGNLLRVHNDLLLLLLVQKHQVPDDLSDNPYPIPVPILDPGGTPPKPHD